MSKATELKKEIEILQQSLTQKQYELANLLARPKFTRESCAQNYDELVHLVEGFIEIVDSEKCESMSVYTIFIELLKVLTGREDIESWIESKGMTLR